MPASFGGIWGHKPSYAALDPDGHYFPLTDRVRLALAVIGPMARNGEDLAAELDVLADIPLPKPAPRQASGWRILILAEHPVASIQNSVKQAIHSVGDAFAQTGETVDRASDLLLDLGAQ